MSESDEREEILKQRKYGSEFAANLRREFQETQNDEQQRQRQYTQEEANRLKEQAEQSQKDDK